MDLIRIWIHLLRLKRGKMSQIFDALQRSDAERNGRGLVADPRATELLQRAEEQAAASRVSEELPSSWNASFIAEPAIAVAEPRRETAATMATELLASTVVRTEQDRSEGPMQCEVLNIAVSAGSHLVSLPDSESPANEAFHLLGVRLRHMRRQRPLKKVLITSTIPQEGKTLTGAELMRDGIMPSCAHALEASVISLAP